MNYKETLKKVKAEFAEVMNRSKFAETRNSISVYDIADDANVFVNCGFNETQYLEFIAALEAEFNVTLRPVFWDEDGDVTKTQYEHLDGIAMYIYQPTSVPNVDVNRTFTLKDIITAYEMGKRNAHTNVKYMSGEDWIQHFIYEQDNAS